MKRLMMFSAAAALVVAVGACDRTPDPATRTGGTVGTSGSMDADLEFVQEQLALGTREIELGRLAQERATHPDVKEFAAAMVQAHQQAATELNPIAANVTPGAAARNDVGGPSKDTLEDLSKLSGPEFDKEYVDQMIDDHQEGIGDLERKAENAANPDVKAWAAKTLPKMREHLEKAKDIQSRLRSAEAPPDIPRK